MSAKKRAAQKALTKKCRRCGQVKVVCKGCGYCGTCGCYCEKCPVCGKMHKLKVCKVCRRVKCGKCVCGGKPAMVDTLPKVGLHERVVNTLDRVFGLEIELATWGGIQVRRGTITDGCRVERDGSVVPSGQELVLPPLGGDAFVEKVLGLTREFYNRGATVNNTCGLHVHVNGLDLGWYDVRRLVRLYTVYEEEIYTHLITQDRTENRYCKPFNRARVVAAQDLWGSNEQKKIKDGFYEMLYGLECEKEYKKLIQLKDSKYGQGHGIGREDRVSYDRQARYLGLNLHSWVHRGTVEWRMKEGTIDPREIVCWGLFCGWMVEAANRMKDRETVKLPGLAEFAREWMPKVVAEWVGEKIQEGKKSAGLDRKDVELPQLRGRRVNARATGGLERDRRMQPSGLDAASLEQASRSVRRAMNYMMTPERAMEILTLTPRAAAPPPILPPRPQATRQVTRTAVTRPTVEFNWNDFDSLIDPGEHR